MSFKTGQVIYLLIADEMKIIPAQIVEVVVRHRHNEDTSTSYNAILPGKTRKIVNLSDIDASVYTDVNELRRLMLENASNSIDKMLKRASEHAEAYFVSGEGFVQQDDDLVE
jgi:hypothetical protein